ncbi:hypothetical protein STENM223S_08038 [Streptomyces tendae]
MTVLRRPRAVTRHRPWPLCRRCGGVALDLGSARTRAWVAGRGMILDVPTVTFPGAGAVTPSSAARSSTPRAPRGCWSGCWATGCRASPVRWSW